MNGYRSMFFFNDTATTEIYTLSLHDALPISHLAALLFGRTLAGFADDITPTGDPATDDLVRQAQQSFTPDRKSTRLNSSHLEMSYAVFCLTKKPVLAAGGSIYKFIGDVIMVQ